MERKEYCCDEFKELHHKLLQEGKSVRNLSFIDAIIIGQNITEWGSVNVDIYDSWGEFDGKGVRMNKCPYCGYDINQLSSIVYASGTVKYEW